MAERVVGFRISLAVEQTTIASLNNIKTLLNDSGKALEYLNKKTASLDAVGKKISDLSTKLSDVDAKIAKSVPSDANYNKLLQQRQNLTKQIESAIVAQDRLNAEMEAVKGGKATYDALTTSIAKNKAEQKALTAEIKAQQREFEHAKVVIGSYRDLDFRVQKLRESYRNLNEEQRKTSGQQMLREISQLDRQLKQIDASMGQYQRNVGNYASAYQKVVPVIAGVAASLGVLTGISEIIQSNATVSDSIADVGRVTQLSKQQVDELYKSLRQIDTRTSLQGLLDIAVIGGKLGVAEKDLIGFTKAADALQVALGKELGANVEETTTKLGKLANIFSADNDKAITGDKLLNIGNAIVFLANKGVASGEFLADFSQRLAGLSGIASITLPQTLGLGAGFEELGQSAEVASTATTQLILKIGQDVPKYAKLAGKPVEEFAKTVEERPVEALIQLSEGLSKNKDGFAQIAESFKDAEAKGVRVGATLGVLGKNADFFRQKIDEGTVAYESQNAILDAYKLKNETAGAALDRLKKTVIDISTSTEFQSWLASGLDGLSKLIQILAGLPRFFSENKTELIALTFALAAFNREAIASAIASIQASTAYKLLTSATERQAIATELLGKAQKALPLLIVVAAIYSAVKAYQFFTSNIDAARIASDKLADAKQKIAENTAEEITKLQQNIAILKSDTSSIQERKNARQSIIEQYPQYLKGIDLEKASVKDLTKLQDDLTKSIIKSQATRLKQQATDEIAAQIVQKQLRLQQVQAGAELTGTESLLAGSNAQSKSATATTTFGGAVVSSGDRRKEAVAIIESQVKELNAALLKTGQEFDKAFGLVEQSSQKSTGKVIDHAKAQGTALETESKEDTKRREKAAKEVQKETSERIKYEEQAAERIAQLRKQLTERTFASQKQEAINEYAESIRKTRFETDQAIAKLSGTKDNVAKEKAVYEDLYNQQADLIQQNLTKKLNALNEQKTAAENAAKSELEATKLSLNVQRSQNTLSNVQASGAVDVRLNRLDELQTTANFTAREKAIRDEYAAKGVLTEGEERQLTELLSNLEIEKQSVLLGLQQRNFELVKQQKEYELNAQLQLLADQRDKELAEIDKRETDKRAKLDEYYSQGAISLEQYQQGLKDIEDTATEERGQANLDFEIKKAAFAENIAIETINAAQQLAEMEIRLNEDKNKRILDDDRRTADEQRALQEARLGLLGTFVSGAKDLLEQDTANRKKYGAVLKALAIAEIAINLQKQISNIAVGISQDTKTLGVIGTAVSTTIGAIQVAAAVAQAAFATAKVLGQKFEYGGVEPTHRSDSIQSIEGGSIPSESGMIQGRSHSAGGVKVLTKFGNFYEVEGGEYRLRNGHETYIINKRSTNAFRSELDTLSSLIRPSVFDPKRRMAAAAINAFSNRPKFKDGGTIVDGKAPMFDTFLLPAPRMGNSQQVVVNNVQQTDEGVIAAISRIESLIVAVNNRIDRIEVINNATDALNAANENATVKKTQNL